MGPFRRFLSRKKFRVTKRCGKDTVLGRFRGNVRVRAARRRHKRTWPYSDRLEDVASPRGRHGDLTGAAGVGRGAFIDRIWADWSPGYDASEDLPKVKECIREPEHFQAALGYYWGQFDPTRFGSPEWAAEQAAAWGRDITQPTLYLHGTQDGCHGMTQEQVSRVPQHCGPGSQSELIDGVGHFMMVQRPTDINKRIVDFLAG